MTTINILGCYETNLQITFLGIEDLQWKLEFERNWVKSIQGNSYIKMAACQQKCLTQSIDGML
jgi:hypothetical protein